jgi:hypothetical protein
MLAKQGEVRMLPGDLDQEELLMMLGDVLTQVASGHPEGHRCPVCSDSDLICDESDGKVTVRCPKCRLDFEGWLG